MKEEICNDGVDNNRNGLIDESCESEKITKLMEGISNGGPESMTKLMEGISKGESTTNNALPEQEICNDGKDNTGKGSADENCLPVSNRTEQNNTNAPIPEGEICGDSQDNDGNGLVDENCEPNSNFSDVNQNAPIPEGEICGDSQDNDGNGLVDENCGTNSPSNPESPIPSTPENNSNIPPTTEKTDKFGIRMLYPTKPSGEEWFIRSSDPEKDPRFSPQTELIPNPDGSFKIKSSKVRMGVFTSSGYKPNLIETLDHSKIAAKGYMQSANDWRDVEITGYIKLNSGSGDNFAWYARGGRHTGFGSPEGCEGVAYKGDLYFDGQTRWTKEQWHTGGYVFGDYQKSMGSIKGKWVGFKSIMYNTDQGGKTGVKLEIWLDKENNNHWIKVNEREDTGGWGNSGRECGGTPDQIITWGGPIATFRWDSASDVDIRDFSVREILP
jgi:hypothetical protein